jgi:hypothetical protein
MRYKRNLGRRLPAPLPVRTTTEWIRFEHEREPSGVFSYLSDARPHLAPAHRAELATLHAWFNAHLDAPGDGGDPGDADDARITLDTERFWFRAEASEHAARARRLAELVRAAGIPIVERRTRRIPGKVRWQDPHQVAVITYRDTPQPRRAGPP